MINNEMRSPPVTPSPFKTVGSNKRLNLHRIIFFFIYRRIGRI